MSTSLMQVKFASNKDLRRIANSLPYETYQVDFISKSKK